jgi:hypothetical protein
VVKKNDDNEEKKRRRGKRIRRRREEEKKKKKKRSSSQTNANECFPVPPPPAGSPTRMIARRMHSTHMCKDIQVVSSQKCDLKNREAVAKTNEKNRGPRN